MTRLLQLLEQLVNALINFPETMGHLQQMADKIAFYAHIAMIVGGAALFLYIFRMPIMFLIERSRWHAMRKIDKEETETAQVRTAVEIAKAKKGQGQPVTTEDIVVAARDDYGKIVLALREGHTKHKL